jgi:SAM-dependent methyltransferase
MESNTLSKKERCLRLAVRHEFINNALGIEMTIEGFNALCISSYLINKIVEDIIPLENNPFMFFRLCYVEGDIYHQKRIKEIVKNIKGSVLDFGGGLGDMSSKAADSGHKVDYWDINHYCREFVRGNYPKVNVVDNIQSLGKYDNIFLFDTLPYIDDIDGLIKLFKDILNPKGIVCMEEDKSIKIKQDKITTQFNCKLIISGESK